MSKDFAALIDAARLREALEIWRPTGRGHSGSAFGLIFVAAEAHLATPPKPVVFEVLGWKEGWPMPAETASTRDAAGRIAARLIEEGCTNLSINERTP